MSGLNLIVSETTDDFVKIAGVMQGGKKVMFKYPVTIKSAAETPAVVLDDHGLSQALNLISQGKLTKQAQNSFCDELVDAIEEAKVDASSTGMELSMPLKLEFRDAATKNAFMSLGRKKKMKKAAAAKNATIAALLDTLTKVSGCKKHKGKKKMKMRAKMAANARAKLQKSSSIGKELIALIEKAAGNTPPVQNTATVDKPGYSNEGKPSGTKYRKRGRPVMNTATTTEPGYSDTGKPTRRLGPIGRKSRAQIGLR